MMSNAQPGDRCRDQALAFSLGQLDAAQRVRYETHARDCATCREELALLDPIPDALLDAILAQAPPTSPELWQRVEARLGARARPAAAEAQPWQRWRAADASWVPASSPWESSGVPGVETRRLHVEPDGGRVTMLVRMAPGASYPGHRHGGAEECFVVSGDLRVGNELHMHAGDFQRVEAGSAHPVQTSDGGCVLLISCSTADELLE